MATILKVDPHPGQAAVHYHDARFKVVDAGRRWGKTRLGVNECLDVASQGGRAWWVSPSYKLSEVGWRPLRRIGAKIGAEIRKADRQLNLANGGSVTVRSADNPESLVGEGLDFVVMDECSLTQERAWFESLRPALSDRQGRALFIGTPKGRNWFWRIWQRGAQGEPGWMAWQFPTSSNPYIPAGEIEAARHDLPDRIFRQEYLAEFMDDAGGVFRRVMDAATANPQKSRNEGHEYVMGVDWGKLSDFTVLVVLDTTTGEVVYLDRFNQIDYQVQLGRLEAAFIKFEPVQIIAESNAMGEPLIEQLFYQGYPVQPFQTTNASKADMINALSLAFEKGEIKIPNDPVLIGELQAFEATRLPSGLIRYAAPEGMHDDTVIALGLAWQGVAKAVRVFL